MPWTHRSRASSSRPAGPPEIWPALAARSATHWARGSTRWAISWTKSAKAWDRLPPGKRLSRSQVRRLRDTGPLLLEALLSGRTFRCRARLPCPGPGRVAGPPGAEPTPGGPARPGPRGRRWASLGEAPGGPVCPRRGGMAVDGEGGECRGVPDPGPDRPAGVRDRLRSLGDRQERVDRRGGRGVPPGAPPGHRLGRHLHRYGARLRGRAQRAAGGPGGAGADRDGRGGHQGAAHEPRVAGPTRRARGGGLPRRVHPAVRRAEPPEPGPGDHRPAPAPRLERRVGGPGRLAGG